MSTDKAISLEVYGFSLNSNISSNFVSLVIKMAYIIYVYISTSALGSR